MLLTLLACAATTDESGLLTDTGPPADTASDSASDTSPDTGSEPGDGAFLLGVNYPWHEYGIDVHTTAWGDYTVRANQDAIDGELAALANHGAQTIRWWVLGDGRAAPSFASDGTPLPIDDEAISNVFAMLDLAQDHGLTVIPVLLDFAWCAAPQEVSGVTLGGHADVFADPDKRDALVSDVFAPLAHAVANHPALAGWDLINEPEWAFNGEAYGLGDHCDAADVRAFVDAAAGEVDRSTVGSGSYAWMMEYWADAAPPVLTFHDYWEDLSTLSAEADRPIVLGEFPTAGADLTATLDIAFEAGFAGAMPWSGYAEDDATALDLGELEAWAAAHEGQVGGGM